MKTARQVLDSLLQPDLAIESKQVFVAPAHNAKRGVGCLGGEIAVVQSLAPPVNNGPRLKDALTRQNPFDAVSSRTIEQYSDNGITRPRAGLARLGQSRTHFGENGINDKVIARERLGAAHARPRPAHAA